MFVIPLILAAGSLSTLISGAPVPSFPSNTIAERSTYSYNVFGGTGELTDGWPSSSSWASLDSLWSANLDNMQQSCTQFSAANPTSDELANVKSAISSVASSTGVDARFIFAIMMQESNGCVRAPTTNYGVRNPGLMQSHDGAGTCNDGSVQNPCPSSEITQMIQDGAGGTSAGDGLQQCISASGASDDSKFYKAARIYNSGSVASTKNLGAGVATHCYASDVANRLLGWTGSGSTCDSNTIGTLSGTSGAYAGSSGSGSGSSGSSAVTSVTIPTTTSAPVPSSTASAVTEPISSSVGGVFAATSVASTPIATPTSTSAAAVAPSSTVAASTPTSSDTAPVSTGTSTPVSSTAEKYPYATSTCTTWYTVQPDDYCILVEQKTGVSMAQLQEWNSGLTTECSNLWLGYQYCVGA